MIFGFFTFFLATGAVDEVAPLALDEDGPAVVVVGDGPAVEVDKDGPAVAVDDDGPAVFVDECFIA